MIVHQNQKIVRYSEEYKLVTVSQQGFKERRGTLTNVMIYIEALTTNYCYVPADVSRCQLFALP